MNSASFDYFIALAQERSFTRAAARLHITQQSLSAAVAALERELGSELVVRASPLALTYAGEAFLRHAREIQQATLSLQTEMADIASNERGVLRIGTAFTRGHLVMPDTVARFRELHPHVGVHISEMSNEAIHRALQDRSIELAVARFPQPIKGVETADFYEERVVLVVPRAMLERGGIDPALLECSLDVSFLAEMADIPFILSRSVDVVGALAQELFVSAGVEPTVAVYSDNMETQLDLTLREVGACFVPEIMLNRVLQPLDLTRVCVARFGGRVSYPISFGFPRTRYQGKFARDFIECARLCSP